MKLIKILLLLLFSAALIFTRFYNLAGTARFDHDDARNLRDIHRIYVTKDLTLIGPINGAKDIIYPSLTFYMLLPFAFLGNFEPPSISYGAAFYGILTVLLLLFLTIKKNRSFNLWALVFTLFWFPLIDSSRIPWNPHLVPFVQALAIIAFWRTDKGLKYAFLSGFLFGLTFHLHYFTIVCTGVFFVFCLVKFIKEKKVKSFIMMCLGFIVTIVPFVIFDYLKPPGLFFSRFLHTNIVTKEIGSNASIILNILNNFKNVMNLLGGNIYGALILTIIFLKTLYTDIVRKRGILIYFFPVLAQVLATSFLPEYFNRYFYLSLVFFFLWLIAKREKKEGIWIITAIIIMIIASLKPDWLYLTRPIREPSAKTVQTVNTFIADKVYKDDLKNVNIAVLASPDPDPLGVIYRESLLIKDVNLLTESQYQITDNLFVVTTSDENIVRNDPANIMAGFRRGSIVEKSSVGDTLWKVFLFSREKVD